MYGFDLSNEQTTMLGWNHYFGKKSMTKLNIFQFNDIWQLGRPQRANEEDDEGGQPEEENPTQREWLKQILSGIEKMNTRMDRMEVTLADIRRHQGH